MAQAPTPGQWLIDMQDPGAGVDRRGAYFHKTLSDVPIELYTQIMACDALTLTQDRNTLSIPGIGVVHHFEGVALPEWKKYMLLCVTDTELVLFPMASDSTGTPNSAALNYHNRVAQQRRANNRVAKAEKHLARTRSSSGGGGIRGSGSSSSSSAAAAAAAAAATTTTTSTFTTTSATQQPSGRGSFLGKVMAACKPSSSGGGSRGGSVGGGGEPGLTAEEAAVAALDNARAAAAKLKESGSKPVDRFGLGHITFLGLQMEGKDNAWLWQAGNGIWADNNYHLSKGRAAGRVGINEGSGGTSRQALIGGTAPMELLVEARVVDANNTSGSWVAAAHSHLKSYRISLVERHSRLPIILHAFWTRCLLLRAGGLPSNILAAHSSTLDASAQFLAAATGKIRDCDGDWRDLEAQCDLLKELEVEALVDPTLKAAFFQANDNALLVWMVDTVDRFEDLLDAAPSHKARLRLFELLLRVLRCLTCFLLHAETSSSRFRLLDPRPFALPTVMEVLGQDFTMMFESVQYVESVKEKLNTTGVGAVYGEGNGPAGLLGFMDDRDDNGSLASGASFGEDHGFHDNEYMDPHTMVDFSYRGLNNTTLNASAMQPDRSALGRSGNGRRVMDESSYFLNDSHMDGLNHHNQQKHHYNNPNDSSFALRSLARSFSNSNNNNNNMPPRVASPEFGGRAVPTRSEAGNDPAHNRRRSSVSLESLTHLGVVSKLATLGRHSTANDGSEFIAGGNSHPLDEARGIQEKRRHKEHQKQMLQVLKQPAQTQLQSQSQKQVGGGLQRQNSQKSLGGSTIGSTGSLHQYQEGNTNAVGHGVGGDGGVAVAAEGPVSSARSEAGRSKIAQEASLRLYGEEGNLRVGEKTLLDDIVDAQIALIARLHHTAYHYACASPAEGDAQAITDPLVNGT